VSEKSPETIAARLARLAPEFAVPRDVSRDARLEIFLSALRHWSASTNLIGRLSDEDLARHALESLLGVKLIGAGDRVVDIGAGGGFPGIPLAIAGFNVTLLEPRERRAAFLRHALRLLPGLNARVLVDRVERLSPSRFDAATVRAVGSLGRLVGKGEFLEPEGKLLIWTTKAAEQETEFQHGFRLDRTLPVPGSDHRVIAFFRKCSTGNTGAPIG
jgi:16S rRNA (guanine527-N7)-methyltransferase